VRIIRALGRGCLPEEGALGPLFNRSSKPFVWAPEVFERAIDIKQGQPCVHFKVKSLIMAQIERWRQA
jgi:hypothetical protein